MGHVVRPHLFSKDGLAGERGRFVCDATSGTGEAQGFVYGIGDQEDAPVASQHAFAVTDIEEGEHCVVETGDIEKNYGLAVQLQGLPGEDFEHFLECTVAAGEDQEGVGPLGHEGFAGVHGVGNVELGDALMGDFEVDEDVGDDADDVAAGGEGGVGHCAHEAGVAAAVDEAKAALGKGATEVFSGGAVGGVRSVCRGAEDGDAFRGLWRGRFWHGLSISMRSRYAVNARAARLGCHACASK
jgi:hypothetical protein